ncbi:cilia and flagella-associated protein 47-like [Rhineura floridana]|uniref:cilia and flagella-associated protein 47-like n=1 Tax=Rhineura floridana TaxID=261503 RepID=UPI002AC7EC54|nr:cilia and flagella-associated protein 47-like [Rhineura floridana]
MAFSLMTKTSHVKPAGILKCKSPCYELKKLNLEVTSPFKTDGPFSIILVESTSCITEPENLDQVRHIKQGKIKRSEADILKNTHNVVHVEGFYSHEDNSNAANESYLQEFFSPMDIVFLMGESSSTLSLHYLPFMLGKRYCAIILVNEQIGEFVYLVEGTCGLPLPSGFLPMDSPNVLCVSSMLEGESEIQPVLCLKCCAADMLQEKLKIPTTADVCFGV